MVPCRGVMKFRQQGEGESEGKSPQRRSCICREIEASTTIIERVNAEGMRMMNIHEELGE